MVGWAKALFAPCPPSWCAEAEWWARFALPILRTEFPYMAQTPQAVFAQRSLRQMRQIERVKRTLERVSRTGLSLFASVRVREGDAGVGAGTFALAAP